MHNQQLQLNAQLDTTPATATMLQHVAQLGRKVTLKDITPAMVAAATEWAKGYTGNFGFMVDMAAKANNGRLSNGMAKGVLNCYVVEVQRKPLAKRKQPAGIDLSAVPTGNYAIPGGDTRLKVRIEAPSRGKWQGWIFVKDAAEYGKAKTYGSQRPGHKYQGSIAEALHIIVSNPFEASKAYGKLVGNCGRCGRTLEDEKSVANGIGPICATKF